MQTVINEIRDFQKPLLTDLDEPPPSSAVAATKLYVEDKPGEPTQHEIVYLEGDIMQNVGWAKEFREANKKLIIDGQNKTIINGNVSIMDCHWLELRNLKVNGCIELNDSYPELGGLKHIRLFNVHQRRGVPWGLFMGGHLIEDIEFDSCSFLFNVDGEHNTYLSGGHWRSDYPAVKNVRVLNCLFGYTPAGRNNFQVNGRFENVRVEGCDMRHAQMNGGTFIGVQNGKWINNTCYGCNRGSGLVIYDYLWSGYDYSKPEEIEKFKATHHPCQNILVRRNTMVVGPKQFSRDAWHDDDPTEGHPAILINNGVHKHFDYPPRNFVIQDNILVDPSLNIIDIYNEADAAETSVIGNMAHTTAPGIPTIGKYNNLKYAHGNFIKDPQFVGGMPRYQFVDLVEKPDFDFANHKSIFNPVSWIGKRLGKGATRKMGEDVWVKGR